ncbi:MAG: restriction endonuclease [Gracilimonas sp.]|jgi:Holliday junction resolvase-like predicted endonuclease|nr:restriction endonuclease [Gracilimonas sp.]
MHSFEVVKATGGREKFKLHKLKQSLRSAGAEPHIIKMVISHLAENNFFRDGTTTKKIYTEAYRFIKKKSKKVASRYKLKESLLEMGPSGYPFEVLISEMFKALDYQTTVGRIVEGKCLSHEVDVIAQDAHSIIMIECKFHNRQDHHSNVTIPLYVHARFQDIAEEWNKIEQLRSKKKKCYVITNTRFTEDAIQYANCKDMVLISWDYPAGQGLKNLLEETQIYPITSISCLSKNEKKQILDKNIVHCQQLIKNEAVLREQDLNNVKIAKVLKEAADICSE